MALDLDSFTKDIVNAFKETLPGAFKLALLHTFPEKSDMGEELAENFGKEICDCLAEPLGERIAAAVDAYIKTGTISGLIVTSGLATTQTATLTQFNLGNPLGKFAPNTLTIS